MTDPADLTDPAEQLVELTTRPNELDAGLIVEVLRSAGIFAVTRVAGSGTLGVFGASTFNPTRVMVREADATAAAAVLAENKQASVDIDWAEVDVGEPQDEIARELAARDTFEESPRERWRRSVVRWAIPLAAMIAAAALGAFFGPALMMSAMALVAVVFAVRELTRP